MCGVLPGVRADDQRLGWAYRDAVRCGPSVLFEAGQRVHRVTSSTAPR